MTHKEKCEMLKDTIYQLYTSEGRSKSYISRLLNVDRKILTNCIKEWGFPENKSKLHLPPATEKFIKNNRDFIIKHLKENDTITNIAKKIKVDRKKIYTLFKFDEELKNVFEDYQNRRKENTIVRNRKEMDESRLNYDFEDLEGEEWRPILGHDNYFVSNCGRIKKFIKSHNKDFLLKTYYHPITGREFVKISANGKGKNLYVARLVGFAFLSEDYSKERNTINHKNGDIRNNNVSNLEWKSQAENNFHAYRVLNHSAVDKRHYHFKKILYKGKFEFNTVTAFAKFLGKSETQARRYMDEPEKYDIQFINNDDCND